jgi:sulfate/thiosulfate transport system ATP-binding protein
MPTGNSVEIRSLTKRFGDVAAVDAVSLDIRRGEFFSLLGPSGCGKTTLLRMIGGFELPSEGSVVIDGKDVTWIPPYRRPVNMVFQHYALFPHLSVGENVAFGMRYRGIARSDEPRRVADALALVQLSGFETRKPDQLSGGQRQRVALARALALEPEVLLLDEPLGALDQKLRKEVQVQLKQLQRSLGITFVFVTHDQEEALEVADRVAILRDGRIEQIGTPEEIYDHPASPFVYDFLGNVNLFSGRVRDGTVTIGETEFALPEKTGEAETSAIAFVRPHDIRVTREQTGPALAAVVVRSNAAGPVANLELRRLDSGEQFTVQLSKELFQALSPKPGEKIFVELKNVKVFGDDYSI